ncbi:serine O-acetyltransferase [Mesoterricola sediminis]|uniref:serine O-acetyltransferase n=1 Tax=Mesoterricola sediminis TaxID=2927980 RepID=A0AA48GTF5_9BACT|nr:DapH/DapD/GlmU-related protein [Mesoterricola sediminis]BDU75869.1 serine acetyltransferase [Mesoterricola sediminis]
MTPGQPVPPSSPAPLGPVLDSLCSAGMGWEGAHSRPTLRREFPSRQAVADLVEDLRSVLFPGFFGPSELTAETLRFHTGATLDRILLALREQVKRGMGAVCASGEDVPACRERAQAAAEAFLARLPEVRRKLGTDVEAAYNGDPALTNPDEAIFCYPGILAITSQRLAHELHVLGVPLIPRMITEHAHSVTGIDIHPGARIGEGFFIDHGTGVVIGETTIIGRNVRIYQGVTLGAKSFPLDEHGNPIKGVDRHPIVEDDVTIYSNATILGRITLGRGAVIGGNVWLTQSVPAGAVVTQSSQWASFQIHGVQEGEWSAWSI